MKVCIISPSAKKRETCGIKDYTLILTKYLSTYKIKTLIFTEIEQEKHLSKISSEKILFVSLKKLNIFLYKRPRCKILHIQYHNNLYKRNLYLFLLPLICRLKNIKLLTTFHNLYGKSIISKICMIILILFSNRCILTSQEDISALTKVSPLFKNKLDFIPVLPNIPYIPIDKNVARQEIFKRHHLPSDTILLSYFGFFCWGKGLPTIFKAIRILKNKDYKVKILLIGDQKKEFQNFQNYLKTLALKLNIEDSLIWTGFLESQDLALHLTASDIYVVPYDTGLSTCRGTFLVGFLYRLPVISTFPQVEYKEFIHKQNIYLISPKNAWELAHAIIEISKNPFLKNKLSSEANKIIKKFNWENVAREHLKIYKNLTR